MIENLDKRSNHPPAELFSNKVFFLSNRNKEWMKFLFGKWYVVFLFCLIGVISGVFYAKYQTKFYESYLTFSLDDNGNSSSGGFMNLAAQFGLGTKESDLFSGENIIEVIKSRSILERVLLSIDTVNGRPITFMDYWMQLYPKAKATIDKNSKIDFPVGLDKQQFSYGHQTLLYETYLDINKYYLFAGKPDKQLNIYVIKFKSPEERFTKVFTDRLLSETIKLYTELKSKKSESTLNVLEQRLATIKGNLNDAISNKASSQDANVNPAFAAAQVPLQKQQLNMQVYGGAYEELYKNLELARFQYLQNIPLLQVINNTDYPMEKIVVSRLKTGALFAFLFAFLTIFILTVFFFFSKNKES